MTEATQRACPETLVGAVAVVGVDAGGTQTVGLQMMLFVGAAHGVVVAAGSLGG